MIQMLPKETATDRLVRDYIVCSFLWNGITKDSLILMDYLYSTPQMKMYKTPMEMKLQLELLSIGKRGPLSYVGVLIAKPITKYAELPDEFIDWMNDFVDWEVRVELVTITTEEVLFKSKNV